MINTFSLFIYVLLISSSCRSPKKIQLISTINRKKEILTLEKLLPENGLCFFAWKMTYRINC